MTVKVKRRNPFRFFVSRFDNVKVMIVKFSISLPPRERVSLFCFDWKSVTQWRNIVNHRGGKKFFDAAEN
jgi:hypothetical protein